MMAMECLMRMVTIHRVQLVETEKWRVSGNTYVLPDSGKQPVYYICKTTRIEIRPLPSGVMQVANS